MHLSRPPDTAHDLVEAEECSMAIADLPNGLEVAWNGGGATRSSSYNGFGEEGSDGSGSQLCREGERFSFALTFGDRLILRPDSP